jgi:D-tyrosyl-tRNA(Tyr) deacylase
MRIILQRVSEAAVTIGGATVARVGRGCLLLVGFAEEDNSQVIEWMADKVSGLRIFGDEEGKMNLDLAAVGGELLVVSQFTLYGNCSKGRRPSFIGAAQPATAIPLYEEFVANLRDRGIDVQTGEFGADMQVALVNDGPVTLQLEREVA